MGKAFIIEQRWLHVAIWANVFCAFLNAIVGIYNNSSAVIFDAVYCIVSVMSNIFLTIYSKKIDNPATHQFQYGYAKLEPALIVMQTLLIISACLFALISAFREILHGHVIKNFIEIAILQMFLAVLCLAICIGCYYHGRKYNDKIILVQALTWLLDFLQSVLIAVGFLIGYFVQGTQYEWISPYIDPVAMICLVFTVIREPMFVFYANVLELLDVSTDKKTSEEMEGIIHAIVKKNTPHLNIKTILKRKSGRKVFVSIVCKPDSNISIIQLAELKEIIEKKLPKNSFEIDMSISI